MKKTLLSLTLSATLLATGASALNIVLTNDDGYQTVLLNALVDKLQTKGHSDTKLYHYLIKLDKIESKRES